MKEGGRLKDRLGRGLAEIYIRRFLGGEIGGKVTG